MNKFAEKLDDVSKMTLTANGGKTYDLSVFENPLVKALYKISNYRTYVVDHRDNTVDHFGTDTNGDAVKYFEQAMRDVNLVRYCVPFAMMVRDIEQGAGERSLGRVLLTKCVDFGLIDIDILIDKLVNERYGRWDDVIAIAEATENGFVYDRIVDRVRDQLTSDINALVQIKDTNETATISLLGKWMPSINASSKATRAAGRKWASVLQMSLKQYRKGLSALRRHLDIVERKICAREFDKIEYSHVPALAMARYSKTFREHDDVRFTEYLESVVAGKSKINTTGTTAPEIVHLGNVDHTSWDTANTMWENRKKYPFNGNVIPVCDVSGSMTSRIGKLAAIDVSVGLSIYMAEMNTGCFHNKIIAFTDQAEVIDIGDMNSLSQAVSKVMHHCGYNTNLDNVMQTVLDIAVDSHCDQSEIPTIVLLSDMEFDPSQQNMSSYNQFYTESGNSFNTVLEVWQDKFAEHGYTVPKIVFWNINNQTNSIPMKANDNGIILISGFNENLIKMVLSDCYDPWHALVEMLANCRFTFECHPTM